MLLLITCRIYYIHIIVYRIRQIINQKKLQKMVILIDSLWNLCYPKMLLSLMFQFYCVDYDDIMNARMHSENYTEIFINLKQSWMTISLLMKMIKNLWQITFI